MGLVTDRMLYFVLANYGDAGHAFVEADIARNSLRQIIVDIATGQAHHQPTGHVFMFNGKLAAKDVAITLIRSNPKGDPSPEELADEALRAIQRALRVSART